MAAQIIHLSDLKVIDGEPRVFDLRLAEALAFADLHKVRDLIKRNMDELLRQGEVSATVAETSDRGGRPSMDYWLNEAQALLISMFSRTPAAADVRQMLIRVFMAYRHGQPAPASQPEPEALGEMSTERLNAKVNLIRLARSLYGPQRAARLWADLGLPSVPALPKPEGREPQRVLAMLLDAESPGEYRIGDMIAIAWESRAMRDQLAEIGIRVMDEPDGIAVSNTVPFPGSVFYGSEFANRRWIRLLRQLPGVVPVNTRYGDEQTRGTFIPADLLEDPA